MNDPHPDTTGHKPPWKPLDPTQRRVLGVLIEKAKTTPAGYPMSLNAIVTGCNQKSNRDPLMELDEGDVQRALEKLSELGAVSEVDWVGRVPKYKHQGYEWLGVNRAELAVLGELLLRGAQNMGDLRARAARMEPIPDLAALKPIVAALVQRGLMMELTPPGRGQTVSHGLYLEPERAELRARGSERAWRGDESAPADAGAPHGEGRTSGGASETSAAVAALRAEVAELRERVEDLARRVERG